MMRMMTEMTVTVIIMVRRYDIWSYVMIAEMSPGLSPPLTKLLSSVWDRTACSRGLCLSILILTVEANTVFCPRVELTLMSGQHWHWHRPGHDSGAMVTRPQFWHHKPDNINSTWILFPVTQLHWHVTHLVTSPVHGVLSHYCPERNRASKRAFTGPFTIWNNWQSERKWYRLSDPTRPALQMVWGDD